MTLSLEIDLEMEKALRARAERAGLPPDRYVLHLLREQLARADSGPKGLPHAEVELLERINEGLPASTWIRPSGW